MRWWRNFLVVAVAVFATTAAAYPPVKPLAGVVSGDSSCGDVVVQVAGFESGEQVLITLGAASTTVSADSTGAGQGVVSAPNVEGTATVNATGLTSARVATTTVVLIACGAEAALPSTSAPTTPSTSAGGVAAAGPRVLASAGTSVKGPVRIAVVVLAAGAVLAVLAMRRRPSVRH